MSAPLQLAAFPPSLWNNVSGVPSCPSYGLCSITNLIVNLIQIAIALAGVLAVVFIILGGIQYIISNGNPQATTKAKSTLTNAIIGLVVVVLAYTIVGYIAGLFG